MALPPELARTTIRVSLGWSSDEGDIERFLASWLTLYRRRGGLPRQARAA
jgi:hypothetical protein